MRYALVDAIFGMVIDSEGGKVMRVCLRLSGLMLGLMMRYALVDAICWMVIDSDGSAVMRVCLRLSDSLAVLWSSELLAVLCSCVDALCWMVIDSDVRTVWRGLLCVWDDYRFKLAPETLNSRWLIRYSI